MSSTANAKYKIGDKFYHFECPQLVREILWVYTDKHVESDEIQYMMSSNQKGYPPSPIEESTLDKYYIKIT
jgi:hypothetical protein